MVTEIASNNIAGSKYDHDGLIARGDGNSFLRVHSRDAACIDDVGNAHKGRIKVFVWDALSNCLDELADAKSEIELDGMTNQNLLEAYLEDFATETDRCDEAAFVETDSDLVECLEEVVPIHLVELCLAALF